MIHPWNGSYQEERRDNWHKFRKKGSKLTPSWFSKRFITLENERKL